MNLTGLCVSLDLARELKADGFPQETVFYWVDNELHTREEIPTFYEDDDHLWLWGNQDSTSAYTGEYFAAPTATEIGEQLRLSDVEINIPWLGHSSDNDGKRLTKIPHWVWMGSEDPEDEAWCKTFDNEAEARAFVWLYLKRNGLLKEADTHESH